MPDPYSNCLEPTVLGGSGDLVTGHDWAYNPTSNLLSGFIYSTQVVNRVIPEPPSRSEWRTPTRIVGIFDRNMPGYGCTRVSVYVCAYVHVYVYVYVYVYSYTYAGMCLYAKEAGHRISDMFHYADAHVLFFQVPALVNLSADLGALNKVPDFILHAPCCKLQEVGTWM